ncbi:hypothetical protein M426DRAFT_190142 [Hypoxylon sp. CI-4A]|nr:hypothetical protein M426DRAFT_190142 [Hypoxylon sp. CI-4A]
MSRFAVYCDWAVTARRCLDGEPPPRHLARFHLWKGIIGYPLVGVEHSTRVAWFYKELVAEVAQSRLDETRKDLYRRFQERVISAHEAHEEVQVRIGTVSQLREPLVQVDAALQLILDLNEYDDKHPVHWTEVFPTENVRSQSRLSPKELWHHFKLESIRPCLVFLVRLLRLLLPDSSALWEECEESLRRREWILQFILDSPRLPNTSTRPQASKARLSTFRTALESRKNTRFRSEPSGTPRDGIYQEEKN